MKDKFSKLKKEEESSETKVGITKEETNLETQPTELKEEREYFIGGDFIDIDRYPSAEMKSRKVSWKNLD